MRVTKDNKLRLDKNERRIGNFVVRDEAEHIKVMDIGQVFTHRADKRTPVGLFLKHSFDAMASDESTGKGLHNWLAVMFAVFSAVPDVEFLERVYKETEACMMRHPEVYGEPAGEPTEEEEADAILGEREMKEFEEEVRNIPDDAPEPEA